MAAFLNQKGLVPVNNFQLKSHLHRWESSRKVWDAVAALVALSLAAGGRLLTYRVPLSIVYHQIRFCSSYTFS
jgi:hypothetical protein